MCYPHILQRTRHSESINVFCNLFLTDEYARQDEPWQTQIKLWSLIKSTSPFCTAIKLLKWLKKENQREKERVCSLIENKVVNVSSSAPIWAREENSIGNNNAPHQKWRNYFDMFGDVLIRITEAWQQLPLRSTGRVTKVNKINWEVLHSPCIHNL